MRRPVQIPRETLIFIRSAIFAAAASLTMLAPVCSEAADGIRMMLKVQIPPDTGNQAIKAGDQGKIFEEMIDKMKPEATYFTQEDGLRTVYFVYTVHDTADFAAIHEPFIQGFGARVYDMPALTWDELKAGFEAIDEKP
ncbi:MAG: hypothetical protein KDJ88_12535 [Bauldia sp.]|nr:hypothetical protein [Bauldia sp.]